MPRLVGPWTKCHESGKTTAPPPRALVPSPPVERVPWGWERQGDVNLGAQLPLPRTRICVLTPSKTQPTAVPKSGWVPSCSESTRSQPRSLSSSTLSPAPRKAHLGPAGASTNLAEPTTIPPPCADPRRLACPKRRKARDQIAEVLGRLKSPKELDMRAGGCDFQGPYPCPPCPWAHGPDLDHLQAKAKQQDPASALPQAPSAETRWTRRANRPSTLGQQSL